MIKGSLHYVCIVNLPFLSKSDFLENRSAESSISIYEAPSDLDLLALGCRWLVGFLRFEKSFRQQKKIPYLVIQSDPFWDG